jgi:hypothetical protein
MNIKKSKKSAKPAEAQPSTTRLQQEVQFWRDMLAAQGTAKQSRESVERMKQALALAEYRMASQAREIQD